MWVSVGVVWLVAYSVLGWVYESAYCTIRERQWENRGFLYGPLCPIYGTGIVIMMALWQQVRDLGLDPAPYVVFLVAALGSALLEYTTSWTLERLFHARWWDYSDWPLNLQGRICLPATTLFGLAGLLVVYVLYEPTVTLTRDIPPIVIEALSLVLVALVTMDATLTVSALTQFSRIASDVDASINEHMEEFVKTMRNRGSDAASVLAEERERFASSMRSLQLSKMSVPVRAAARRVHSFVLTEQESASSSMEQHARLRSELREGFRAARRQAR